MVGILRFACVRAGRPNPSNVLTENGTLALRKPLVSAMGTEPASPKAKCVHQSFQAEYVAFMRAAIPSFIAEFPLRTSAADERVLEVRLEAARHNLQRLPG